MPELPEVETVRRDLAARLPGRTIVAVRATGARSVRRAVDPAAFEDDLRGAVVTAVDRHGKYLLAPLDDGRTLAMHLRMSGQLRWHDAAGDPLVRHTHVVLTLDSGAELRFVDPRTFGELFLLDAGRPELAHLGPDAVQELATPAGARAFVARLRGRRTMVKTMLLDQRFVAGIGNIYSDEILHAARVRFDRRGDSLSAVAGSRIAAATADILARAIVAGGSSLADGQYVDTAGQAGRYQLSHLVYAREGLPCERCGAAIVRTKVAGRSTFWCRRCQR